jgi:hypothetical protein
MDNTREGQRFQQQFDNVHREILEEIRDQRTELARDRDTLYEQRRMLVRKSDPTRWVSVVVGMTFICLVLVIALWSLGHRQYDQWKLDTMGPEMYQRHIICKDTMDCRIEDFQSPVQE